MRFLETKYLIITNCDGPTSSTNDYGTLIYVEPLDENLTQKQ